METINSLMGRVLFLIVVLAVAIVIAQNYSIILSVLLAAGLLLVIAKLLWPSPRRR
jgi:hypothetical protein